VLVLLVALSKEEEKATLVSKRLLITPNSIQFAGLSHDTRMIDLLKLEW